MRRLLAMASVIVVLASCAPAPETTGTTTTTTTTPPSSTTTTGPPTTTTTELPDFSVSSPGFEDGDAIPVEYTCDGADVSPELNIVGLPVPTRAITVIVEDPDAPLGVWYHWVEFDIPASPGSHDIGRDASGIGVAGLNSWNLEGYMGPCPPEGEEHRYVFHVYALDSALALPAGVGADEVIAAMDGHVVDSVDLVGRYGR
jgi:Raf kinase inhibitor-like YbhB/YbcL family protein